LFCPHYLFRRFHHRGSASAASKKKEEYIKKKAARIALIKFVRGTQNFYFDEQIVIV